MYLREPHLSFKSATFGKWMKEDALIDDDLILFVCVESKIGKKLAKNPAICSDVNIG